MKKVKYVIIGGGISGLYFANLAKNDDYILFEKSDKIGGYCGTFKTSNFIWDYAGHFYHFKNEEIKKEFINALGEKNIITQKKNTKIYYKGKYIDYPFQKNIHQLEKEEFIECLYDLYTKNEKENYDNFLDMLYGKFGKSIVEKFLKPYNEKLYACPLEKLDKDAMGRFFPYANIDDIIRNMKENNDITYNDTFLYPKEGAQSFLDYLYNNLDKTKVLLKSKIIEINEKENYVKIENGQSIYYEYLINTSPFNELISLLDNKYIQISKKLSYNKVLVFNIGFEKDSKNKEHWIYFPDKNINFYRIGLYNNILGTNKMSIYVEIGFSKNEVIDIDKEFNETIKNLKKCNILSDENQILEYNSIIMDPAYVHINTKELNIVNEIKDNLEANDIYTIGRYGNWTYCSMEDCMLQAKKIYEKVKGRSI